MKGRDLLRRSALAVVVSLVLLGCSDDGDSSESEPAPDQQDATGSDATSDGGTGESGATPPEIDPAAMPPPGEARVEVDGNTFTYRQSESLGDQFFTCEPSDDAITVNFQTDGDDLLVQVNRQETGEWFGSVVVTSRDTDLTYQGTAPYDAASFAADEPHVVYEGPFESYSQEDPGQFTDAGEGRIEVTCP